MHEAEALLGIVALAVAVGAVANRLRTPAASLLVLVGLGIGFLPGLPAFTLSSNVLILAVLPPLLFSSAQQLSLVDLAQVWRPVAALAGGLVVATAVVVAFVTHLVAPDVGLPVAFTLGAILASTDPVSVAALSRELRLPARVATLVQAESLFNDATSLVLFEVVVGWAAAKAPTAPGAIASFARLGLGGAALGVLIGLLAGLAVRQTHEPVVQAAVALLTPYVAAVSAAALSVSPVTAVILAGILLARRHEPVRASGRLLASSFYDVMVFLLESGVFALIGLQLAGFIRALPGGEGWRTLALLVVLTLTLLAVRGIWLAAGLLIPSRRRGPLHGRSPWQVGAVVTWAGARGVVPLIAALSIPLTTHSGQPFPHRPMLLVISAGVVVLTLVAQGTTLAPLARRLHVTTNPEDLAQEILRARYAIAVAGLERLDEAAGAESAAPELVDRLRAELNRSREVARRRVEDAGTVPSVGDVSALRRRLLSVQSEELARLRMAGEIGPDAYRRVQHQLDLELARLRPDQG